MKLKELTTQLTYFFSIWQMAEVMGLSDTVRQLLSEQKRSKYFGAQDVPGKVIRLP